MAVEDERDPSVPKLPRGRGVKLSMSTLFRIAMTAALLVALIVLRKPCSDAVGNFIASFDGSGSAAPASVVQPSAGSDTVYVELHPGMTDDEVRAAIATAKAKAAALGHGSGSATP